MKLKKYAKEEWNRLANDITVDYEARKIFVPEWIDKEIRTNMNEEWLKKAMMLKMMYPEYEMIVLHIMLLNK